MRTFATIVVLASLGCGIAAAEVVPVPLPRPRPHAAKLPPPPVWAPRADWHEPVSFRDAAGPDFKTDETTSEPSACRQRLETFAQVEAMPRLVGPGACGGGDLVRLDSVTVAGGRKIEIKPAPLLRCPMAEQLALWVRDDTVPQVAASGAVLVAVDTYDDFDCRGRNRKSTGKVSEHGKANAVDVRGLTFADGRFAKLTDILVPKALRDDVRRSACERFTTVLGPGSDGYHEEHIHLDLAERHNGYRICQWDVREPPPPPPPKVAEQPKPGPESAAEKVEEQAGEQGEEKVADVAPAAPEKPTAPAPAAEPPRVQLATIDVPLPRARPAHPGKGHTRRKSRGGVHIPFNIFQ